VKDLGYFSDSQYGIIKELEKKEINLLLILVFCKKITNILLIKRLENINLIYLRLKKLINSVKISWKLT
jgi:hypothetical protein